VNKFDSVFSINRPVVCIQGLGFVGAAMAVAVSEALDEHGEPYFNVIGVDLPNSRGIHAVNSLNQGIFPAESNDEELRSATLRSKDRGNLIAVTDEEAYSIADVVIVDVNLDLGPAESNGEPTVRFDNFQKAIEIIGNRMKPKCLVLVETTVPPGTCENIVYPRLKDCFKNRNLSENSFYLAHSYERVMPGEEYLYSIINFWRVFAGINEESAIVCENFLKKVVNTTKYPMTRLKNTTSSETAKVLENSYRATNIAFIEEWGRFAEEVGVDLFSVIDAIRVRPTHSNIRQPGFGVGGYCLTKDPLFARVAAKQIFKKPFLDFPFSRMAVEVNNVMPTVSVKILEKVFNGDLMGKKILLLGVSYRPDVSDTRYSPSEIFARSVQSKGASVTFQDPMVKYWDEMNVEVHKAIPEVSGFDAIVFAVGHKDYLNINFSDWLKEKKISIIDTNRVLSDYQIKELKEMGCLVSSVGRGE
jgi:UDP-N-acetyl-D-glucosamine dehydrogenase